MNRLRAGAALSVSSVVLLLSPTVAMAAEPTSAMTVKVGDKSRIEAPATAIAGEEVTIRTLFNAWENRKVCFTPRITWGDEYSEPRARYSSCSKTGRGFTPGFELNEDQTSHTYERPGTYVITADAEYVDVRNDGTAMRTFPARKRAVKGDLSISTTITITSPNERDLSEAEKAAVLTPGSIYGEREDMVRLVNALDWPWLWQMLNDADRDIPTQMTYDVAGGHEFVTVRLVTPSSGYERVKIFKEVGNRDVFFCGNPVFRPTELPPDGHVILNRQREMYVWSTNPGIDVALVNGPYD